MEKKLTTKRPLKSVNSFMEKKKKGEKRLQATERLGAVERILGFGKHDPLKEGDMGAQQGREVEKKGCFTRPMKGR